MLNREGLRQRPLQIGSSRRPPLLKSLRNPERIAERRPRVGSLLQSRTFRAEPLSQQAARDGFPPPGAKFLAPHPLSILSPPRSCRRPATITPLRIASAEDESPPSRRIIGTIVGVEWTG
jgi:hypothetical protein